VGPERGHLRGRIVSGFNKPVPKVARVLLRVEWMDGQVREFDAEEPHGLEVAIGREPPPPDFDAWAEALGNEAGLWRPEHLLGPEAIYDGGAFGVEVRFKANSDSSRHPFTIREPEL